MLFKVHVEIVLPKPIMGSRITALAKKAAVRGDFQDLELLDGDGEHLKKGNFYSNVYIVREERTQMMPDVGYDITTISEPMVQLRDLLVQEIDASEPVDLSLVGRSVKFDWENTHFEVDAAQVYYLSRVVLPDGTVLDVTNWFTDSVPPCPEAFVEIPHPHGEAIEEIAAEFGAAIATAA